MPSPFPGMDPYLEEAARWPDVHQSLITYIRDALQPEVRPRYYARIGERVYILNPVEHREPYVEIVHAGGDEVVAVIEVLSPANKAPGEGHQLYRRKQQLILDSPAHLIEIDLLSAGLLTVAISEEGLASLPPHRYLVSVRRAPDRYRFEVYPIPLQQRLPRMHIPLREPDPDVGLDLQQVFTQCYDNGGYADLIDYRRPHSATLSPEEAAWLDGLLKGKGLRA